MEFPCKFIRDEHLIDRLNKKEGFGTDKRDSAHFGGIRCHFRGIQCHFEGFRGRRTRHCGNLSGTLMLGQLLNM